MSDRLVIKNVQIITPDDVLHGWLQIVDGKIAAFGDGAAPSGTTYDGRGATLLPGFIDMHVHGAQRHDTMDASVEGLQAMGRFFAMQGVTAFLPTTLTASREATTSALNAVREAMRTPYDGARILGAHLEGPYINPAKSGAQNSEFIRAIDRDELLAWLDLNVIRLISVAPELDDIAWLVKTCAERDVIVSAAHTTATYEQAQAAIDAGLSHATHTFNAMPGLHHRQPGALAALALAPAVRCELIADNIHVHPAMMRLLHQIIGAERLVLITDAMQAAGMPDGDYTLGGYAVRVENGEARLHDGTLAGSTLTMQRGFANFLKATDLSIEQAWRVTSYNAALELGLADCTGKVAVGYDADLVLLADGDPAQVQATFSQGQLIYESGG